MASTYQLMALGTAWSIDAPHSLTEALKDRIGKRLEEYDRTYSRFRDDSIIARMKQGAGRFEFPEDFARMYGFYQTLYRLTDGRVTPLIGAALEQAGYDKTYSLKPGEIAEIPGLETTVRWSGSSIIETNRAITFDVGAAGKGYAVDIIADIMEAAGYHEYVIDASGDIRHRGHLETIGLEDPYNPERVIGVMHLKNKSLCASSINRRAWRGLHHVFDPKTLRPVNDVVASWVVADDTMTADGLATALFFEKDASDLQREFDFSFVRVFTDGSVDYTPGFEGELYI